MRLPLTIGLALLLGGCAAKPPMAPMPPPEPTSSDPQQCLSRTDCTTKTSRTLMFVFDYAEAGGALVQRKGNWLFTPTAAKFAGWPALKIRLAEPPTGRFEFGSQCPVGDCRIGEGDLLRVYRSYLGGQPCSLLDSKALARCLEPASLSPVPVPAP